jgi:hypothetical protein
VIGARKVSRFAMVPARYVFAGGGPRVDMGEMTFDVDDSRKCGSS